MPDRQLPQKDMPCCAEERLGPLTLPRDEDYDGAPKRLIFMRSAIFIPQWDIPEHMKKFKRDGEFDQQNMSHPRGLTAKAAPIQTLKQFWYSTNQMSPFGSSLAKYEDEKMQKRLQEAPRYSPIRMLDSLQLGLAPKGETHTSDCSVNGRKWPLRTIYICGVEVQIDEQRWVEQIQGQIFGAGEDDWGGSNGIRQAQEAAGIREPERKRIKRELV